MGRDWSLIEIKENLQDDMNHSPLRPKHVAADLGISYSTLTNTCNPNLPDFQMSLKRFKQFMELTGGRRTLMHLCESVGGVFMPLPKVAVGDDDLVQSLAEVTKEFGDVLSSIGEATSANGDGGVDISALEGKDIEREIVELQGKTVSLLRLVREKAKG